MVPEKPENDDLDPSQSVAAVEPRELWDKKPDESRRAFDAFCRYRDAEKRSFKAIADSLNCSTQNVWQWSTRHNWKLRCDAYDCEQDRVQRAEFARNKVRVRERHMQVARAMLHVAGHALREWADQIEQRLPLRLAPEQIAMLVKAATELENRTMGTEAENKYTQIIVNLGDAEPIPDAPSAALSANTVGERSVDAIESDQSRKPN